jgi:hypothetical protein
LKTFRVFIRSGESVDVPGESYLITRPDFVLDNAAHPALLTYSTLEIRNARGEVVGVFPQDAWYGLTVGESPDWIITGKGAEKMSRAMTERLKHPVEQASGPK